MIACVVKQVIKSSAFYFIVNEPDNAIKEIDKAGGRFEDLCMCEFGYMLIWIFENSVVYSISDLISCFRSQSHRNTVFSQRLIQRSF
jgi:hypothetical protein